MKLFDSIHMARLNVIILSNIGSKRNGKWDSIGTRACCTYRSFVQVPSRNVGQRISASEEGGRMRSTDVVFLLS